MSYANAERQTMSDCARPMHSTPNRCTLVAIAFAGMLFALGGIRPAVAHEFWIEPAASRVDPGTAVPVTVALGQDFVGTPQPYIPNTTVRFDAIGPDGTASAAADFAETPAGRVQTPLPGLYTVVFRNKNSLIKLEPKTFEIYALKEGLEHALEQRRQQGLDGHSALERYTRFPKTFILAGPDTAAGIGATRPVGEPFELVPQSNPFTLAAGDTLPVRVLFNGEPLPGILVQAFQKEKQARLSGGRTDDDGVARITLPLGGRWLISAVHIVPVNSPPPDWESYWGSITLDVPAVN